MKKTIGILTILLIMAQNGVAQSVNDLFDDFSDEPGAECVNVAPLLMGIVKTFVANDPADGKMMKNIKSIKMLNVEECSPNVKQAFAQRTKKLKPGGMELLMKVNDNDGETTTIWGKMKKETVCKLLIVTDDTVVQIKGDFNLNKLSEVIKKDSSTN